MYLRSIIVVNFSFLKSLETKGSKLFKTIGKFWFFSYSAKSSIISFFVDFSFVNKVTFIAPTVSVGTLRELELIRFWLILDFG